MLIATRLFEKDKIAYVKDTGVTVARSLAMQFRIETRGYLEKIKPIIEEYDHRQQKFSDIAEALFAKFDRLDGLVVIKKDDNGRYKHLAELKKTIQAGNNFINDYELIERMGTKVAESEIAVAVPKFSDVHLVMAASIESSQNHAPLVVIGLYRASELYEALTKTKTYENYLLSAGGDIEIGPKNSHIDTLTIRRILSSPLPDGAFDDYGGGENIISFSGTGVAGSKIASVVKRKDALGAVNVLITKSLLFFIALLSSTVIIGLVASLRISMPINELSEATKRMAMGQFDVRVISKSNDEIGELANGFNFMANEVSRLMNEAEEKARITAEMETIRAVQSMLIPTEEKMSFGKFYVIGHFEPATECGGDWWNCVKIGDRLFLWIGDATGHGAPAAMVTSAAKAASTIIEDMPFVTPGVVLEVLNKAIYETSRGQMLMTFFVASIDMRTGEMTYANASHEPPFIVRRKSESKITKKDLIPLINASGPRLGDKNIARYIEAEFQLIEGDSLILYTDGVIDLRNPKGEIWGERGFVRAICESVTEGNSAETKISGICDKIKDYRKEEALPDDLTILMCQYGEAS
ncbi:MAG: hypothetical protein A2Z20_01310 [Bdellovibrionales bacterium RBG_16_40_8]|nr:MAG: hypothetical protein A2Z20_01310 [Bdellovibrionales bacterium RBG_16_40_8]